jgi:hypothetical protein
MSKFIRTSEEFAKVRVESADDRFVNRHPDVFDAEDWEVAIDLILHRFENLKDLSTRKGSIRAYTQRLLTARPHITARVQKSGGLVDFDRVDGILEKLYTSLFGSISTGRDTASPELRKKRKAPAKAKSKINWKGPLGKLMEVVVTLMGLGHATNDYAATFVAMLQVHYGRRMTVNPKALEVEIHRQKRALETAIKAGKKVLTSDQIKEQLSSISDEDLPFLVIESVSREGGGDNGGIV